MKSLKPWQAVVYGLGVALLVAAIAMGMWLADASAPMPAALGAMASDDAVTVARTDWIVFTPTGQAPTAGFIFYPGGKVDPRAYAPPARTLAEAGYRVVIVPMPLNLAVVAPNRADAVIAAFPEVTTWAIGGHSLGGSMAATYALNHPGAVDALIFWASYPASDKPFAAPGLRVWSIYGTRDGLATPDEVLGAHPLLPADAVFVPIEGGNHAQFGYYGEQKGDNPATISREAQQAAALQATLDALRTP